MGSGYNPYRDDRGRFAKADGTNKLAILDKATADYEKATAEGDHELANNAKEYIIEKHPNSEIGQKLLEESNQSTFTKSKTEMTRAGLKKHLESLIESSRKINEKHKRRFEKAGKYEDGLRESDFICCQSCTIDVYRKEVAAYILTNEQASAALKENIEDFTHLNSHEKQKLFDLVNGMTETLVFEWGEDPYPDSADEFEWKAKILAKTVDDLALGLDFARDDVNRSPLKTITQGDYLHLVSKAKETGVSQEWLDTQLVRQLGKVGLKYYTRVKSPDEIFSDLNSFSLGGLESAPDYTDINANRVYKDSYPKLG